MEVLRAERLACRYRSGADVLVVFAGLSLQVNRGEMVAIVGESGTGKSSLLHLLSGLDRPSEGDVYFGSRSLAAMGEEELAGFRNREIGFVWQQSYLLPEFTAQENVMMPLLIAGRSRPEAGPQAAQWLDRVGVGARLQHRAGELSGGEQQRVAMARALVGGPSLLMADEPTGNLDERSGAALFALLRELHREQGLTSLVVTHNPSHAAQCDRCLRLHQGQLSG
ncbi:MAG: ABC transporter ATP-binding protein [Terriglobales bacterium]